MTTDGRPGGRFQPHEASLLMRHILVIDHDIERQLGRELGVNSTDLDAMQHLMRHGRLSPSELAQRLGISTAAATVAIDRLVRVGHVTREPHPTDRRRLLVVPRPESVQKAMGSLMPMIRETNALLDDYTDGERAAITDYLARTLAIMQRRLEDTTADTENAGGEVA
jgi:DNA-binding MarR family transcriptional regulator